MRWILFIFSALAFIEGFFAYSTAETILQQIFGLIGFVVFAIFFSGAAVVDSIVSSQKRILNELNNMNSKIPDKILGSGN